MMSKYIKIEDLRLHLQNLVLDGERLDPKTTRLIIMTLRELPIHEFDDECENGQTAVRINLNEIVKFKLSERGEEIYRHRYDGFWMDGSPCRQEPKLDDDGYMSMQLWTFMQTFGEHMTLGMPEVLKPLEIIYEQEDE